MLKLKFLSFFTFITLGAFAQQVYFVDGYHGGMYGHFPLWNTQFYVDNLDRYPEWRICIEIEPETWDVAQRETPDAYRAFQKIAGSSRVEFTNPTMAQPYMYNISGESIIRQLEHGMAMVNKHFPDVRFTTYSVEEPCFTSALPQILKSFGFKYAVLKCPNTCWGGYSAAYGGELVNWTGPDGTAILTVPRYACEELGKKDVWTTAANANSREYLDACFAAGIKNPVGMTFQDAGWRNGPWIGKGDSIKNKSVYTTWTNYFENISTGKTDDTHHFTQEAFLPGLMWGSQVLQKIAQEVRRSENNLIMAEKMNVMNYLASGRAVDNFLFRKAWYNLALSQHHDSWIVPYNGLFPGQTWAQAIEGWTRATDETAAGIMQQMLSQSRGGASGIVRVVNTTATPREELVEATLPAEYFWKNTVVTDEQNTEIPLCVFQKDGKTVYQFVAKTPAFGYADYNIREGKRTLPEMPTTCSAGYDRNSDYVVESDVYRIVIDVRRGGVIKSLVAKKMNGKEFVDGSSEFGFGELRGFFYDEGKFRSTTENLASVSVVQQTPSSVTVKITGQIAEHPTTQYITLTQGQDRIDCRLEIDWKGNPGIGEYKATDAYGAKRRPFYDDRYKLVLLLPAALGEQQVYKNAPFDVCESRLEDTFYANWDSIKHNIILNWVDFTGKNQQYGMALFSDHTTTYTHGKNFPAGLTIQYSGNGLWGRNYAITRPSKINYALLPHTQKWDKAGIWNKSVNWNEPLTVKVLSSNAAGKGKSFVSLNKTGYEITATEIKNGEVYLRIFNAEGDDKPVAVSLGFSPKKVEMVQLNGEVIKEVAVKKDVVEVAMPRFGLVTLKMSVR
jgi:alpha-mannosidase